MIQIADANHICFARKEIMEQITAADMQQYLTMDDRELYALLVPAEVREQQAFSKDGLWQRGRVIFSGRLQAVRRIVCQQYQQRGSTVKNSLDLAVLIGTALAASPTMLGIPVLPMTALLVKIGLEEVCRGESPAAAGE
jgi:hypothetical protein